MATPKKIEKNNIEVARQRLLAAIYSELPDDRFLKKDAVKQLLSTLIAARERGLAFEKIAEILQGSGLELPAVTLRSYFFELKTQAELATEDARHAKKIAETRDAIHRKVLDRHADHAAELAAQHARKLQSTAKLVNAFGGEPPAEQVAASQSRRPVAPEKPSKLSTARPASPAAPVPPPAAPEPARLTREEEGGQARGYVRDVSSLPTSEANPVQGALHRKDGEPLTLGVIEAASLASDERTELEEDVELRGGDLVFYVSGRPFHGLLSKRQVHLLRSVGRIVKPTKGNSSKDFVAMPTKL